MSAGQIPGVTRTATYIAFVAGALTTGGRPDLSFQAEAVGSLDGLYFTDRFAVNEGNAVAAVPARLAGTTPVATILRSE